MKADLIDRMNVKIWHRENQSQLCAEPVFMPDPNGKEEDDGREILTLSMTCNYIFQIQYFIYHECMKFPKKLSLTLLLLVKIQSFHFNCSN